MLFILAAVAEWACEYGELSAVRLYVKPLLVPLLVLGFGRSLWRHRFFWIAMTGCWLGDVLLLFEASEWFFIFGLLAFLTAHIFLSLLYRRLRHDGDGMLGPQKLRASFPLILWATGLVVILFPKLGPLQIPVIFYSLVLLVMVLQALFRYGFTSSASFWQVFLGAFLFLVSDSLLALNKFLTPLPQAGLVIMITYVGAIFFIVTGLALHPQKQ